MFYSQRDFTVHVISLKPGVKQQMHYTDISCVLYIISETWEQGCRRKLEALGKINSNGAPIFIYPINSRTVMGHPFDWALGK